MVMQSGWIAADALDREYKAGSKNPVTGFAADASGPQVVDREAALMA